MCNVWNNLPRLLAKCQFLLMSIFNPLHSCLFVSFHFNSEKSGSNNLPSIPLIVQFHFTCITAPDFLIHTPVGNYCITRLSCSRTVLFALQIYSYRFHSFTKSIRLAPFSPSPSSVRLFQIFVI